MSEQHPTEHNPKEAPAGSTTPSRRDRVRPIELVGFSAVLAIFSALVVLLVLRNEQGVPHFGYAGIVAGVVFIIVLMVIALIGLGGKPSDEDVAARKDLRKPGTENWH